MKQDAKAMHPVAAVQKIHVDAEVMPAIFQKSSAAQKTASTTTTENAKRKPLKFHPAKQAIAVKQNVTPSK